MIEKKIDKQCIFCWTHQGDVYELMYNNVHQWRIGYKCNTCECIWNDETETKVKE